MAKRHIIPLGKHKPIRSSWGAMDMQPNRTEYEYHCYRNGQAEAMLKQYNDRKAVKDKCEALTIWETLI